MKKHIGMWLILMCLLPAYALAAPVLSGVLSSDAALVSGADGWYFDFTTSEGGTLGVQLLSGETGEIVYDVGSMAVDAGSGRMSWNGILADGSKAAAGDYMAQVQLKNFWGEESETGVFALHIFEEIGNGVVESHGAFMILSTELITQLTCTFHMPACAVKCIGVFVQFGIQQTAVSTAQLCHSRAVGIHHIGSPNQFCPPTHMGVIVKAGLNYIKTEGHNSLIQSVINAGGHLT